MPPQACGGACHSFDTGHTIKSIAPGGRTRVEVGFFFWPYDTALIRSMAEAADAFGYDMVGIADTPGNAMDPWVATTLLAAAARRARVAVLCHQPGHAASGGLGGLGGVDRATGS